MGAIKDIVDLAKDLESRAKERKDIEVIQKIQSLTLSLQSHHAEIVERDIRFMEEHSELKRQFAESKAEEVRIHKGIEFRRGKRTGDKWMAFCPKCHMPADDARSKFDNEKVALCSARCGWQVFKKVPIDSLMAELGT